MTDSHDERDWAMCEATNIYERLFCLGKYCLAAPVVDPENLIATALREAERRGMERIWKPADSAPERKTLMVCQYIRWGIPAPLIMSREGNLWFWEPEHRPASVIPTHWTDLLPEPAIRAASKEDE